jgi:hypothetical protein
MWRTPPGAEHSGMTTAPLAHTDVIVLDYLAALWAESEELSPELRDELMATVADYIAARRNAADPLADPAAIMRRLGPPEALVAAARRGHLPPHVRLPALIPPPPAPTLPARNGGAAEYTAIGLLAVGSLIMPVVGPVAGMLMVSASPHWAVAEKATGWVLVSGSVAAATAMTVFAAAAPFHSSAALLLIYLTLCAGSVAAGVQLLSYLRNRRPAG